MLHRDFSVSPSPIRAVDDGSSPYEQTVCSLRENENVFPSEGASFRATKTERRVKKTERRDSVSASAATPTSSADEAKPEEDARALDRTVIEELKATLAEAYERERALESALAEAKATDASRAETKKKDAGVDVDVSFSV